MNEQISARKQCALRTTSHRHTTTRELELGRLLIASRLNQDICEESPKIEPEGAALPPAQHVSNATETLRSHQCECFTPGSILTPSTKFPAPQCNHGALSRLGFFRQSHNRAQSHKAHISRSHRRSKLLIRNEARIEKVRPTAKV